MGRYFAAEFNLTVGKSEACEIGCVRGEFGFSPMHENNNPGLEFDAWDQAAKTKVLRHTAVLAAFIEGSCSWHRQELS